MKKKNIKILINSVYAILIIFVGSCLIKNTRTKNIDGNKKLVQKVNSINNKLNEEPNNKLLIDKISKVNNYLSTIQEKQSKLLKMVINSSFVILQRSSFFKIKHTYLKQATKIISESNQTLAKESFKLTTIINLIKLHKYDYSFYLNKDKLVIPTFDFFYQKSINKYNNNNSILNSNYYINKTNSLNKIGSAAENNYIGAAQITKSTATILYIFTKDYKFKGNVICYNELNNQFQLANDIFNSSIKNKKVSDLENNTFINKNKLNLSSLNKKQIYTSKIRLTNILTTENNNIMKFNYHNECFHTYYDIRNVYAGSKNICSYTVAAISFVLTGYLVALITPVIIVGNVTTAIYPIVYIVRKYKKNKKSVLDDETEKVRQDDVHIVTKQPDIKLNNSTELPIEAPSITDTSEVSEDMPATGINYLVKTDKVEEECKLFKTLPLLRI